MAWVDACGIDDIDREDVIHWVHEGLNFALYRSPDGEYFATDGLCTHERVKLADGLVMGDVIECPKHNGRFNYKTGKALAAPVCVNLKTYPTNLPPNTMVISWTTIPLATNRVYYSTNLVTWRLLTNIYVPTEPFIWPAPYPGPATNVMVFDPVMVPGRFYRVSVEPWLTFPY